MIDWILRHNANTMVYLFYSPWVLILLFPLTPYYGVVSMIMLPVFLIIWIQVLLYYAFIMMITRNLRRIYNQKFSKRKFIQFHIHSWINLIVFTIVFCSIMVVDNEGYTSGLSIQLLMIFSISEIIRFALLSKILISLELKKTASFIDGLLTFFIVINPLIGLWNLHDRLKKILLS